MKAMLDRLRLNEWMFTAAMFGVALSIGLMASILPPAALVLGVAALSGSLAIVAGKRLPRIFVTSLGVLLVGYAFFGRGFAYLGVPPLFVGEIVMVLGLAAVLLSKGLAKPLRSPVIWLWLALALWSLAQTVPYVGVYGTDALRDAVIWGYGIFAILVCATLDRVGGARRVTWWYGRYFQWFLLWAPVAWYLHRFVRESLPRVPGGDAAIVVFNPGDVGVHLGGVAAFFLLGLGEETAESGKKRRLPEAVQWCLWLVTFALVASWTRGGGLAAIVAICTVLVARPRLITRVLWMGVVAVITTLAFAAFDLSIETGAYRGRISPQELVANLASSFRTDRSNVAQREGTREWRLEWWTDIVNYTVRGRYFWTGKGFGINLATDDGYQVNRDNSLRSPHNGHMTVLARAGVPGAVLWFAVQLVFGLSLMRAYMRAHRSNDDWWKRLYLWIMAYWLASHMNATFDVYLEAPQGGIWFWCLMGFGVWAILSRESGPESDTRLPERQAGMRAAVRTS